MGADHSPTPNLAQLYNLKYAVCMYASMQRCKDTKKQRCKGAEMQG